MSATRILVRGPNYLGDAVLARPLFWEIRRRYPEAHLVLLARPVATAVARLELLFNEVWDLEGYGVPLLNKIRKAKFELGINVPASLSSACLLFLGGVRQRVGFAELLSVPFLTRSLLWQGHDAGRPKADLYLDLLKLLGPSEVPLATVPKLSAGGSAGKRSPYLVFSPGASILLRQWPHSVKCIQEIRAEFPEYEIEVVGGFGERHWSNALAQLGDSKVHDRIGRTSVEELLELCRGARAVVAMDSGVAHLSGTLAQTPTLTIFGPGDPAYVAPKGPSVKVVRSENLTCSPCESAQCRGASYQACLRELSVDQVVRELRELLNSP